MDANEVFTATRAKNLSQMESESENKERTQFAGQTVHVELDEAPTAAEYVPVPQVVHDASADPPAPTRYLPAPQSVQFLLPAADLYLPATHAVQIPPLGPEYPALQVQFAKAELPVGELEFVGQGMHVELIFQKASNP
jgi:hypothetical protein